MTIDLFQFFSRPICSSIGSSEIANCHAGPIDGCDHSFVSHLTCPKLDPNECFRHGILYCHAFTCELCGVHKVVGILVRMVVYN